MIKSEGGMHIILKYRVLLLFNWTLNIEQAINLKSVNSLFIIEIMHLFLPWSTCGSLQLLNQCIVLDTVILWLGTHVTFVWIFPIFTQIGFGHRFWVGVEVTEWSPNNNIIRMHGIILFSSSNNLRRTVVNSNGYIIYAICEDGKTLTHLF